MWFCYDTHPLLCFQIKMLWEGNDNYFFWYRNVKIMVKYWTYLGTIYVSMHKKHCTCQNYSTLFFGPTYDLRGGFLQLCKRELIQLAEYDCVIGPHGWPDLTHFDHLPIWQKGTWQNICSACGICRNHIQELFSMVFWWCRARRWKKKGIDNSLTVTWGTLTCTAVLENCRPMQPMLSNHVSSSRTGEIHVNPRTWGLIDSLCCDLIG